MRKVLCSLIVLAILVGMFVCLGAQAFADGEPKDLAIVAVSDAELSAGQIERIKQDKQDCDVIVIDVNGLNADAQQSGEGYGFVYNGEEATADGFAYIWPNMPSVPSFEVTDTEQTNKCKIVLLPIGAEDTAEGINAVIETVIQDAQNCVVIAIAPEGTAVQAAVDSNAAKVLTSGDPGISSDKLIKVGSAAENPVSVLVVDEMAGVLAENMPLPEASDPGVGAVEPQAGEPGLGPVVQPAGPYTITFNPGGGTGDPITQSVGADQSYSFTFPENSFTAPEGCTFLAWQSVDDFLDHQPGDTLTEVDRDMTFQATWSEPVVEQAPATFSVTYVPGEGATGTPYVVSDVTADMQLGMIEMPADFAKEGFTFTGWLMNGEHYNVYDPFYVEGETTITAEWTANEAAPAPQVATLTYVPGEGFGEQYTDTVDLSNIGPESMENGQVRYGVPECTFTAPEGKAFAGWQSSKDGQIYQSVKVVGTDVPTQLLLAVGDNITLTAQWAPTEAAATDEPEQRTIRTVVLKANADSATEGVDMDSSLQEYAGNVVILPECAFTAPENYVFAGWVMAGTDNVYKAGDEYTMTDADVTFVAKWTLASAVVTYVADNGTDATHTEPVALTEGTAQHTLIAQPAEFTAPEGKTFGGWLVSEGNTQQPATAITVTGDMQIKAVWNDAAKAQNQDPGATTTGDVNYTQGTAQPITLSYTNAVIAAVFVDNAQLVEGQDYTLSADGMSFTFIDGYLNKLEARTHTLNVTFQDSETATYISNTRNLVIAAASIATEQPAEQPQNYKINWSDRSASVSQTFASAPVKVEIYYGEQTNADGSKTPVYREAVRDRDYTVSGNTLTLLPELINGNWGVWPNATYSLRVTLEDNGIAVASAAGTNNPVTLQISLSGATPAAAQPSPTPTATPDANGNVPVTGDETPLTLYIVVLLVLIVVLAVVLIVVMRRRNAGNRGRHNG